MSRARIARILVTLLVTGACVAYLVWKVDIRRTGHILAHASIGYFALAVAIMAISVLPMAWRWQQLLRSSDIREQLGWLVRAYFVSYTAGQVLPTSIGGDASRIYETARRHPGRGGSAAGIVLLERALGGAATLTLAAVGFALAVGRYHVGAYLWIEAAFVAGTVVAGIALFSRAARRPLRRFVPLLRAVRLERPVRAVYEAIHEFRSRSALLLGISLLTLGVQAVRVLAIWSAGKSVGVDLSPRPYFVMGPLLFLVMLVPFTINGLAVRESFFVSFLGTLGVSADQGFSAGFLFFLVTVAAALPGAVLVAREGLRARPVPGAGPAR